jgi:hypothetical protein
VRLRIERELTAQRPPSGFSESASAASGFFAPDRFSFWEKEHPALRCDFCRKWIWTKRLLSLGPMEENQPLTDC